MMSNLGFGVVDTLSMFAYLRKCFKDTTNDFRSKQTK